MALQPDGSVDPPARRLFGLSETVIWWSRPGDSVLIYSADDRLWRRLDRLGLVADSEVLALEGHAPGRFYLVPVDHPRWELEVVIRRIGMGRRRRDRAARLVDPAVLGPRVRTPTAGPGASLP